MNWAHLLEAAPGLVGALGLIIAVISLIRRFRIESRNRKREAQLKKNEAEASLMGLKEHIQSQRVRAKGEINRRGLLNSSLHDQVEKNFSKMMEDLDLLAQSYDSARKNLPKARGFAADELIVELDRIRRTAEKIRASAEL